MNTFVYLDKTKLKTILKRNKDKAYTYGLCKESGELYYVGIGVRDRVLKHNIASDIRNNPNRAKINTYLKHGCKFVLFEFNTREKCAELEQKIIAKFGRIDINTGTLTNLTDGGEHAPHGYVPPVELRQRKSKKAKESSDLYSEIAKQQWTNMSDEEKENRRQDKAHMMLSRWSNPEYRELKRQEAINRWSNPDFKAEVSLKIKESQPVEHLRSIMKNKWADPEFREMMIESRRIARIKKKGEPVPITQDILQNET